MSLRIGSFAAAPAAAAPDALTAPGGMIAGLEPSPSPAPRAAAAVPAPLTGGLAVPGRSTRWPAAPPDSVPARPTGGPAVPVTDYMERLVKLIPAEVVGLYLVGVGIIPTGSRLALAIWGGVCLGLVILARAYATRDLVKGGSPQWWAVLISSISFVIWLYLMPGPFQAYNLTIPYVGSLAVLVWAFVVPYFYKG